MARRDWTTNEVAAFFAEAAQTARRLPPVRVQGYFNVWPAIVRQQWETFPDEGAEMRPMPPLPDAIERLMRAMHWVQFLEVEDRHLVWMRARDVAWNRIARRFGCNRTTAWRRWKLAVQVVVEQLNAKA